MRDGEGSTANHFGGYGTECPAEMQFAVELSMPVSMGSVVLFATVCGPAGPSKIR